MPTVDKAVAAVVRTVHGTRELLVFQHPQAGVQLPKGTVEPGEALDAATLRELHEESGLLLDVAPTPIGRWQRVLDGTFGEVANFDLHVWHVHLLEAPAELPDRWSHSAIGSPEEQGLEFKFHWLPIDADLQGKLDPVFRATVELLRGHFA